MANECKKETAPAHDYELVIRNPQQVSLKTDGLRLRVRDFGFAT